MAEQLRGDEHITFDGMPTGHLIGDFWRWASSDLLSNTLRGVYSEFIVATALGADTSSVREEWTDFDLFFPYEWQDGSEYRTAVRVEVKSAAYLQSWKQTRPSPISFGIQKTLGWTPVDGYTEDRARRSDVYVFCLYNVTDRDKADLLSLDGWDFYVVSTRRIDEICGNQRTITLSRLRSLAPIKTDYDGIRPAVEACLKNGGPQ